MSYLDTHGLTTLWNKIKTYISNYHDTTKQNTLVSGTNIKTVNSNSLLGSGNVSVGTYSKPSSGIPKTDLASAVQTSLGRADTALQSHQDISGKEDTSNKVTAWSSTTTDTHYPSEKLVKTDLDNKMDKTNPAGTGSFSLNRKADTVIGINSFVEGSNSTASGMCSHAEGDTTTASNTNSHAEGGSTTASGGNSHAEGSLTNALGSCAHAEGNNTTAYDLAHAEGYDTVANGYGSHAEGWGTKTYVYGDNYGCHAQGRYNVGNGLHADIVGNGTADDARSNAYALDWNGNGYFAGDVYVGCDADSTGGSQLAKVDHTHKIFYLETKTMSNFSMPASTSSGGYRKIETTAPVHSGYSMVIVGAYSTSKTTVRVMNCWVSDQSTGAISLEAVNSGSAISSGTNFAIYLLYIDTNYIN